MSRAMGDSHRRFLQTMMSNGIISTSQAEALHKHCCETHGAHYVADRLDDFINVINSQLQPLFMYIRKGMSEENGLEYYALVNMTDTEITRMASDYADNELELFRKTMDLIVDSESGSASSTDILNCADSLRTKKLKKKETEHVLNKFVQDKWLNEKDGEYTLSVRCVVEMEQYMRTIYQDLIKVCHVCHNIALQCQMCENPACGIKVHLPCAARYFRARSDPHCPACNDFWPHEIPDILKNVHDSWIPLTSIVGKKILCKPKATINCLVTGILQNMFNRRKKLIQVWNNLREMQHFQSQSSQNLPSSSRENTAPTPSRRSRRS